MTIAEILQTIKEQRDLVKQYQSKVTHHNKVISDLEHTLEVLGGANKDYTTAYGIVSNKLDLHLVCVRDFGPRFTVDLVLYTQPLQALLDDLTEGNLEFINTHWYYVNSHVNLSLRTSEHGLIHSYGDTLASVSIKSPIEDHEILPLINAIKVILDNPQTLLDLYPRDKSRQYEESISKWRPQ